jgi:hypothetical protein
MWGRGGGADALLTLKANINEKKREEEQRGRVLQLQSLIENVPRGLVRTPPPKKNQI